MQTEAFSVWIGGASVDREILKGHLPVIVLGLLAESSRHGYAICQAVKERSRGALDLGEGTLYPLLYRLEAQGHIRGDWEQGDSGKPRKVYRITGSGRRLIRAHKADWARLRDLMREFLGEDWAKT